MTVPDSARNARRSRIPVASIVWSLAIGACIGLAGCAAGDDDTGSTSSGGSASFAGSASGASSLAGTGNRAGAGGQALGGFGGSNSLGGGGAGGSGGGGALTAGGSSTGGSTPMAGSGSGGGSAPFVCGKSTGADPLIDDFEDSNIAVAEVEGRRGIWENFDDSSLTGSYTPKYPTGAEGRNGSVGYCVAISGYKEWGANLVANMSDPKCGYDASSYKGVCFWAKGSVDEGGPIVFAVGTGDTVPATSGGKCAANCNAHYQLKLTGDSELTDEYQEYCVEWGELALPTISQPKPLDPKAIVQMEWKFPAGAGVSTDGEICIDDVRFMQ